MNKLLSFIAIVTLSFTGVAQQTINVSMGAGYADEVYYKLDTETQTVFAANSWDVAFLRIDAFNHGIRVNDGIGISVYEASNDPSDYNTIDIANEPSWTILYNDDTNWDNGAFMQGSATYGWGEYNPANHHIEGTIVFVLKYADGTYRKFLIEDYFGEYTFRYATWDGSAWVNDTTYVIDNDSNPANRYNYYSLQNDSEVVAEPAETDWDFVFTKYNTYLDPPGSYYNVSGALHNANLTVAQVEETSGDPDPNGLDYSEEINTIGYDWKSFNGSDYDVNSNMAYYVKYDANTVYRVHFTEFEGSATGNLTFVYEDVSNLLGIETVTEGVTFGMYPNPSTNGIVEIVYERNNAVANLHTVSVHNMNGSIVYRTQLGNDNGFFNKTLDLSSLQSGMYVVTFTAGDASVSKKLVIQ